MHSDRRDGATRASQWPSSCDVATDVAGDCAEDATAAVLAELLTSLCAVP